MAYFCYKCGAMDHVTGKCRFEQPMCITTNTGISARLYGQWLKAKNPGSLLFVNLDSGDENRRRIEVKRKIKETLQITNFEETTIEEIVAGNTQLSIPAEKEQNTKKSK